MMEPAVTAAIITGSVALLGIIVSTVITITVTNRKRREEQAQFVSKLFGKLDKQSELADARLEAKLDKAQAVTDTKIEELTREVRAHNNFAQRVPVLEEQIKVANHRIGNLEAAER